MRSTEAKERGFPGRRGSCDLLNLISWLGIDFIDELTLDVRGRVYAVHADGNLHVGGPFRAGWPAPVILLAPGVLPTVGTGTPGAPALADIDGSGRLVVAVFGAAGPVHLYDAERRALPRGSGSGSRAPSQWISRTVFPTCLRARARPTLLFSAPWAREPLAISMATVDRSTSPRRVAFESCWMSPLPRARASGIIRSPHGIPATGASFWPSLVPWTTSSFSAGPGSLTWTGTGRRRSCRAAGATSCVPTGPTAASLPDGRSSPTGGLRLSDRGRR